MLQNLARSAGGRRFTRSALALGLMLLTQAALAASDVTHITIAGRDVAIWKPVGAAPLSGFPVILFSHGLYGCNTQSIFLMEALAHAGYLVLAPNHKDARCGSAQHHATVWYPGKIIAGLHGMRPQEPLGKPEKWSDATYRDREADMKAVLDEVLRGKTFQGVPVDAGRIGIAGHSLGGYTVLGVAGAWPSWKDSRVKAVLALSPYANPFFSKGDLGHMDVPVMYQTGTRDIGVKPFMMKHGGAFDRSSVPKYYVEFEGATHFAWTNLTKAYQDLIDAYSVAFFDHYLNGKTNPDPLTRLFASPLPHNVSSVKMQLK